MPEQNKKYSLSKRMTAMILSVVTAAVLFVSVTACLVTTNLYKSQMNEIISSKLGESRKELDMWLDTKVKFTEFIASEVVDRGYIYDREKCKELMVDCAERDSDIFDTYIGFSDLSSVFGSDWEPTIEEYNPVTRDWYNNAKVAKRALSYPTRISTRKREGSL